jgi:uncharacterized protein (TIGR02246 family)
LHEPYHFGEKPVNPQTQDSPTTAESQVRALYFQLLEAWNQRRAGTFATLFTEEGHCIGFDGSQMDGRAAIEAELGRIFADHVTAAYVGKVREVRVLAPDTALLRAVSGMVPPGQADLNPAVNTIQSLVAVKHASEWRIALYQNTPAQFHGRPELAQKLTEELRELLK